MVMRARRCAKNGAAMGSKRSFVFWVDEGEVGSRELFQRTSSKWSVWPTFRKSACIRCPKKRSGGTGEVLSLACSFSSLANALSTLWSSLYVFQHIKTFCFQESTVLIPK